MIKLKCTLIPLQLSILKKIGLVTGIVVMYVLGLFYGGSDIIKVIRITVAEHEYTKGIPIEVFHGRRATVTYVYYVNGERYKAKIDTTIFYTIRQEYTVIYMKANPAVSVLKEHVIGSTIENSILLTFLIASLCALLYCAVLKRLRWCKVIYSLYIS